MDKMSPEELNEIRELLGEMAVELLIMRARIGKTSRVVDAETIASSNALGRTAVLQTLRECGANLTAEVDNLGSLVQRFVIASQRLKDYDTE